MKANKRKGTNTVAVRFVNPGSGKIKKVLATNAPTVLVAPPAPKPRIVKFSPREFRLQRMQHLYTLAEKLKALQESVDQSIAQLRFDIAGTIEELHRTNVMLSPAPLEHNGNTGSGV